jgi:hypothetical protein
MVSGSTLLLTITGRKTKHPITTPVNYIKDSTLLVLTNE